MLTAVPCGTGARTLYHSGAPERLLPLTPLRVTENATVLTPSVRVNWNCTAPPALAQLRKNCVLPNPA